MFIARIENVEEELQAACVDMCQLFHMTVVKLSAEYVPLFLFKDTSRDTNIILSHGGLKYTNHMKSILRTHTQNKNLNTKKVLSHVDSDQ